MKFSRWLLLAAAAPLVIAGCDSFGQAMTSHTDVVARAAGHELKVEEAARMLSANPEIPADPQVVQQLASVWVDYTLLATAIAEDTALAGINLEAFIQPAREQMVVMKLRERVIRPDTALTEEALQQRWASEGPGAEIRARHILLRVPGDATPAQRDSVQRLAEELRQRAAAGEDFAALAGQYSQDPGSAARGGDLGFFGRGRMVAPFEEAAFNMQPGEVSPVIESPFGLHIIRLEERRQQELGEQREQFRQFLVQRAEQQAETAYLDSLAASANVAVRPDALPVVREIAGNPSRALRGRATTRVLASYSGGDLTSGEFAEYVRTMPPHIQNAFATAPDDQVEGAVKQLAQKELLLQEAERQGVALSAAELDSVRMEARQAIREIVQISGFAQQTGGNSQAVIEQQVKELIEGAIRGERQLVPLGQLSFALREQYGADINQGSFPQVVSAIDRIRSAQGPPAGAPGMPGSPGQMPQQQPPQGMPQQQPQEAPQPEGTP
ncbi:MAG: peptidylprolyl isomerase [Longimicrobiaceae bacterium]